MKDEIELRICDDTGIPVATLDVWETFEYVERYYQRHPWTLTLNRHSPRVDYLKVGRIILYHDATDNKIRALIIKLIDYDEDSMTISGNDLFGDIAGARICLVGVSTGTGYDTIAADAETVMRHYISGNITDADDERRRCDLIELEPNPKTRGNRVPYSARLETLLEALEFIGTLSGSGWECLAEEDDTTPRGWKLVWHYREGLDRSISQEEIAPIILTEENGTVILTAYSHQLPEATVSIVAGQGETIERTILEVGDSTLTGLARREVLVDARDTTDSEELQSRGEEKIAMSEPTVAEMEYVQGSQFRYLRDFQIGDIITGVTDAGVGHDLRIVAVKTVFDNGGRRTEFSIGKEMTTIVRQIQDMGRQAIDRR